MYRQFGSFVSFLFLLLIFVIIVPVIIIQLVMTSTTVTNLKNDIDHRLTEYAEKFISSFHKECARCEGNLLFARNFIFSRLERRSDPRFLTEFTNRAYKETVASYFFDSEQRFYRISLLDHNGANIFSFIANPDQTYLAPQNYEEFRDLPPINVQYVKSQIDTLFFPTELLAIPGGYAQRTIVALKDQRFLLADINVSNIIANSMKISDFSPGSFLLVFDDCNNLLFNSSSEIKNDEAIRLKNYMQSGDYKIRNRIYRTQVFTLDSLPSFCKSLKNISFVIGLDYAHMLAGIRAGLGHGLSLTTILAVLICVVFVFTGLYLKNKTDMILRRTNEIAGGEFDKKLFIKFPSEFRYIANNINELSSKLKVLTREKVKSAKLSAIGRFAAHMVHDLRNPVYGLSLLAYELKKVIAQDDPRARYFDEIVSGIKRLGGIIDKIADHGRIYEPKIEEIDLNKSIKEIADEFAKEFPCKIITQLGDIGIVKIDPNQWRRVFLNLFQNSYEAKKEDCQILIVTKGAADLGLRTKTGKAIIIEISDQSGGIPEEILSHIFEPFTTTKKRGIGLGLSYIKEIVEVHKGEIKIENNYGIGVKFIITLPTNITNENE